MHVTLRQAPALVGALALFALGAPQATAQVQWTGPGANGHYYQAIQAPSAISWEDAQPGL